MSVPMPGDQDAIRSATLQGRIIVGALAAGLVMFLVISTIINILPTPGAAANGAGNGPGAPGAVAAESPLPIITYAAVAFGAVLLPMSFVVPGLVAKQQRRAIANAGMTASASPAPTPGERSDAAKAPLSGLPAAFLTQLIIGAAIDEGAAFFALVAYLIEKNPIALAMAVVLIAGVIARFPTAGRVERWIEQQQEKLREEQLDARSSY
jgi:hypothetical protein